eukprot:gb/GEZN01019548.1/.p1 GENE.gb/GEZN01019548.1/~~gb/GEZN01019548.1/.p1  ORF type:complete len:134 (-),score=0.16 gb/GEZN01019548.1/:113-514(-)
MRSFFFCTITSLLTTCSLEVWRSMKFLAIRAAEVLSKATVANLPSATRMKRLRRDLRHCCLAHANAAKLRHDAPPTELNSQLLVLVFRWKLRKRLQRQLVYYFGASPLGHSCFSPNSPFIGNSMRRLAVRSMN